MRKKKLLKVGFITVLLFSAMVVTQFVYFAVANPNPFMTWAYNAPPIISIHSPLDNETYSSNGVSVEFTITKPEYGWANLTTSSWREPFKAGLSHVSIVIDGELYRKFPAYNDLSSPYSRYENLTNLEDGAHNLKIIAHCVGLEVGYISGMVRELPYDASSDLIVFTVDATSPFVSVLYPENDSYESTENLLDVTLNFTVNEPVSQLTYSLDGHTNVTVAGNTTLTGLSIGVHNVTVYATDNVGNIGSETITFTIAEPQPEPFPTTLAAASTASVAVIGVGLTVYFKKRKR